MYCQKSTLDEIKHFCDNALLDVVIRYVDDTLSVTSMTHYQLQIICLLRILNNLKNELIVEY